MRTGRELDLILYIKVEYYAHKNVRKCLLTPLIGSVVGEWMHVCAERKVKTIVYFG